MKPPRPRVFLCALLLPSALVAQTIRGRMVQETTRGPVAGGAVFLIDSLGHDVTRAMTDAAGQFVLTAPTPGRYRLRSAVIGWRTAVSPSVALERDATLSYTFVVRVQPVHLDSIIVSDEFRCDARDEAGSAVVALWEEARKALNAVSWSGGAPLYFRWIRYSREIHPLTFEVLQDTVYEQTGRFTDGPFKTLDPEALWREGFVRRLPDGGWVYEGPDAAVFLSNRFAGYHCFGVDGDSLDYGMIGLRFRPVASRDVPEIAGTFWLDRMSGELRKLEFRFVHLPRGVRDDRVGGLIDFQRLPSGQWIVRHWWIRMPFESRAGRVILFKEDGAVLKDVSDALGHRVMLGAPGIVTGIVYDSLAPAPHPMDGASVSLVGTPYRTMADPQGRFALRGVASGVYEVQVEHPDLMKAPPLSDQPTVTVLPGGAVEVWLGIPSAKTLWSTTCPGVPYSEDAAAVTGIVTADSSGDPVSGAIVAVQETAGRVLSAVTGRDGRYAICGVDPNGAFTVRAAMGDAQSEAVSPPTDRGRISREDLVLRFEGN